MSGFIEIAKIVIKYTLYSVIVLVILSILANLLSLTPVLDFMSGLLEPFKDVINFTYNVLYFWTGGAFRYIYIVVSSVLLCKITFWLTYGLIQSYKIFSNWLLK